MNDYREWVGQFNNLECLKHNKNLYNRVFKYLDNVPTSYPQIFILKCSSKQNAIFDRLFMMYGQNFFLKIFFFVLKHFNWYMLSLTEWIVIMYILLLEFSGTKKIISISE